jgi:hypothetical protein
MSEKSSKSGTFRAGKIIPLGRHGCETTGTPPHARRYSSNTKREEFEMYIGLGGLLILILILWLLGVI